MSAKSTTVRKAGSALRGPRGLERLLIVAAVAAVLVAFGAWIAMNRPGGGAEAAGAQSSLSASSGASADASAMDAADAATGVATDSPTDTAAGDPAAASAAESAASASAAAAGQGSSGSGSGTGAAAGSGATPRSGTTTRSGTPAAPSSATGPLSPTTAFLTALTDSGLAPPVDDAQKLAMADDVCQELGYGSKYADVVRALTFAGASDAEAANFARLAIRNICPQYKAS